MKKLKLIFVTILLLQAQINRAHIAAAVCALMLEASRKSQAAIARLKKETELEQEKIATDLASAQKAEDIKINSLSLHYQDQGLDA